VTVAPGHGGAIRVVIADDQPLIRQGFAMILGAQAALHVVSEADDGTTAIERVHDQRPDVVLMDIRMPVMDGIEATRRLSAEGTATRVLIVTTFGHDEYVAGALAAGAAGFVLKDATPEELVHAVRVVAGGDALLSPAVTTRLIARVLPSLSTPDPTPTRAAALELLTDREREVLLLLAAGGSNAEIGEALFISETTVKTHISHVLTKLQLRDRVQAVIAAYETGLLSPGSA